MRGAYRVGTVDNPWFSIETKVAMSMEGNETLRVILIPRRGRIISH